MAEDWDLSDLPFSRGDGPDDFHSETTLKALTYLAALNGSEMRLSSVNNYKGYVRQMWQDVAEGRASDVDTIAWAKGVAQAVCKNVIASKEIKDTSEKARDSAMKSLGLSGRKDDNREARETLVRFLDYFAFIREVSPNPDAFPAEPSRSDCLAFMREQGFYRDLDDKSAGLRIDRLRYE